MTGDELTCGGKRASEAHRHCAAIGAFSLPFRAKCFEGVGQGTPERGPEGDLCGIKCCKELDRVR